MKKTIVSAFFCFSTWVGFAQNDEPVMVNGGQNPQNVSPALVTPTNGNPICVMYKRDGRNMMECGGRLDNTNITLNGDATPVAYYPTTNTKDIIPYLKNDGSKIWLRPAYDEAYTILQDPPCYIYKRHDLVVMECPGIQFAPEH